ncbi:unnamed protein product [Trichobilharzia szidati]|nr:unnamed protein product [Trichobilharzia szidati]
MNYGKGVITVCRRRCKSSELRHTGKMCSCSSGPYECLCSVCVTSEYGRHKNRMQMKQTRTDYPTDKLKRKLSSNAYTTNKNKQSYHNQTSSPQNNSLTSDLYDITECLISESVRDNLLLNKSDSELERKSPINKEVSQLVQCSNVIMDQAKNLNDLDNKLSAWANWLLEKEKQKRKQKKEAQKKQAEEAQKRSQLMAQKLNRRKIAEEKCKEWIQAKQKEMAQMKKRKEIEKKEKEVKKLQELLERTEKARLKYEEWCKRKHEEKDRQIGFEKQIEMSKQLANRSRQEASAAAYTQWLKMNGNKKCLQYYSHGYSDGKLIDYYDRTANPPPSFVNPNPWINPAETTSVNMTRDMNERLEYTPNGGLLIKKRTSSKTTTTTTTTYTV